MLQLCAVGQKIELACKSKQERDMWVNALDRLIRASKNPSPVEPATDSTMKRTQDGRSWCRRMESSRSVRFTGNHEYELFDCISDMYKAGSYNAYTTKYMYITVLEK